MGLRSFIYTFLFFSLSVAGIYFFGTKKFSIHRKPYYFAPPEVIKHFAFGYNDIYADVLWIRYLQDADYCSFEKGIPVYDGKTKYQCDKGWAFYMANAITELAPRFKAPYVVSGTIMGVLMGDKEGARLILDKAVKQFPKDWQVLFHAGNHYLIELKEHAKAAEYILAAAKSGGPAWLYGLSAKLYTKAGQIAVGKKILEQLIKDHEGTNREKAFKNRLKKLHEEGRRLEQNQPINKNIPL